MSEPTKADIRARSIAIMKAAGVDPCEQKSPEELTCAVGMLMGAIIAAIVRLPTAHGDHLTNIVVQSIPREVSVMRLARQVGNDA